MGVNCPYRMILTGKDSKRLFVAWTCGLGAEHGGWHHPSQAKGEIVTNYFTQIPVDEIALAPAEVLDREWLAPEDISARTKLGRLARKLEADGWEVHVGKSTYYTGDTFVKASKSVKPGKTAEWVWVDAVHRRTSRHLTANADGITLNGKTISEEELWSQ